MKQCKTDHKILSLLAVGKRLVIESATDRRMYNRALVLAEQNKIRILSSTIKTACTLNGRYVTSCVLTVEVSCEQIA